MAAVITNKKSKRKVFWIVFSSMSMSPKVL
jgi:hypothetical protein